MSRSAASTAGTKRSHASLSTSKGQQDEPSLSLTGLAPLSPPSSPHPPSPPTLPPFTRSASSLRLIRSHLPYLYDFFYEFSMDWPFYCMCWGVPPPLHLPDLLRPLRLRQAALRHAASLLRAVHRRHVRPVLEPLRRLPSHPRPGRDAPPYPPLHRRPCAPPPWATL